MNTPANVEELERALLRRAEALAAEYKERAERSHDRILAEENDRLRLREEREMLSAKAVADRTYRRLVQQAELSCQEALESLRWTVIRNTMDALPAELIRVTQDEGSYLALLAEFLASAARSIGQDDLVCEVNAVDLERLQTRWESFAKAAVPRQRITLHPTARPCSGGLMLRTRDDRIRVDNTFEGRLARLEERLERIVQERLFAAADPASGMAHFGAAFHG